MTGFFVTNQYLNEMFPLANCPEGSMDNEPERFWYIQDLSKRYLAALFIKDEETMKQLRARLLIHQACRNARGIE